MVNTDGWKMDDAMKTRVGNVLQEWQNIISANALAEMLLAMLKKHGLEIRPIEETQTHEHHSKRLDPRQVEMGRDGCPSDRKPANRWTATNGQRGRHGY